jgi:hypothetical protein
MNTPDDGIDALHADAAGWAEPRSDVIEQEIAPSLVPPPPLRTLLAGDDPLMAALRELMGPDL